MPPNLSTQTILLFSLLLSLLLTHPTFAQSTSTSTSSSSTSETTSPATTTTDTTNPSTTLAIAPGGSGYVYAGCWNETTGYAQGGSVRALAGGSMATDTTLTAAKCFAFCAGSQYAGLEYGQECWCAPYLSALSTRLDDARCDIPCKGANKTACGGSLTISLFNRTGSGSGSGSKSAGASGVRIVAGGVGGWGAAIVAGVGFLLAAWVV